MGERAVDRAGEIPPVVGADREWWGYGVWGTVLAVILIPELWAASTTQKVWPTISGTVGHLEYRWDWVGLIVVAAGVWVAVSFVRYPGAARPVPGRVDLLAPARTPGGRATRRPTPARLLPVVVVPAGAALVAAASMLTATLDPADPFALGDVLYGSIALCCAAGPSVLAYLWARDVPFPTFFSTLANLEQRAHFVSVLVLAGLGILLFHLALYPWPNVFHVLRGPPVGAP